MTLHSQILTSDLEKVEQRPNLASWYTPGLADALGDRLLMFDNTTASSLELLRFKPEFSDAPVFESALRRTVDRLAHLDHPAVAKVRAVDWLGEGEGLALISNQTPGRRLSELVRDARGTGFAIELVRQLTPVLAALQREGGAHGLLTPERIVVTPEGRLIVTEHVLGAALESLHLSAHRLRAEFGIAVPLDRDGLVLDPTADIRQLGYLALSLLVGERVDPGQPQGTLAELLQQGSRTGRHGGPAPPHLTRWIGQALQLGGAAFDSAHAAHQALHEWPDDTEPITIRRRVPLAFPVSVESRTAVAIDPPPDVLDSDFDFVSENEPERPPQPDRKTPTELGRDFSSASQALSQAPKVESFALPATVRRIEAVAPAATENVAGMWTREEGLPATAVAPPPVRPARPGKRGWIIAALTLLSLAEAAVIAALLVVRPALPSTPAPPAPAAPVAATPPIERAPAPPLTPAAITLTGQGRLEVTTDLPGARVVVDGTPRGATPLAISLEPGEHTVVISVGATTTRRTVNITAGGTSTLMASLGAAGAVGGWITIATPVTLQVLEGGNLLGTTESQRIMLPAGRHQLDLTNATLGYSERVSVDIEAGRTVTTTVVVPNGSLSVNALPWANVWLDGQSLGTTPFANLPVPLGTHEVIWRHPQLGERRQSVVVTTRAPVRVVMDFSK